MGSIISEEGRAHLEHLIATLSAEEVKVKTQVILGTPFVQVVREVWSRASTTW